MANKAHSGVSIFSRILIAFLLVNLTTSAVLLLMGHDFVKGMIERRTVESIGQQIAVVRARFEEEYLEDTDQWLRWLATSSHVDDYLYSPPAEQRVIRKRIQRLLKQAVTDFNGFEGAVFADADGEIVVTAPANQRAELGGKFTSEPDGATRGAPARRRAAMSELYEKIRQRPLLISSGAMEWFMPPRQVLVEGPFVDDAGKVCAVAGLATLDVDTGLFGGAVLTAVTLEPFLAELRELTFFGESLIWVLGPGGEVLQRPESAEAVFDPSGLLPEAYQPTLGLTQAQQGIIAYQDFSIVPGEPFLRVAVTVPRSVLLSDLAPALRYFTLILAASIVVALLVSLYVSRYLSRPIVELAAAAVRLAAGDLNTRVPVRTTGEVQTLVESFNQMTDDLRESGAARDRSMASLRREIAERERVEQELRQQARDLGEARIAAEAAGRAKGDFLATMSHEIRTPINGMLGMTELLLASGLDERQRQLAETAQRSGETLLEIISDILDFSKIEAGKLELHGDGFDLREVVEGVGEIFANLAQRKGVELVLAMPPEMHRSYHGDAGRLRQVLVNLVGNAVKFTEEGEVVVSLAEVAAEEGRHRLRFEVRDTGLGIAPDAQVRIFDAFSQADASSTREHGGTGLGLAISREIVGLMGGEIGMQSTPGAGALFWFTVALVQEPPDTAAQDDSQDALRPGRVIVVDDNASQREVLARTLDAWGMEHAGAGDAGEALDALRHAAAEGHEFEVALVDTHMPGVNGIDLARAIKADPALRGTAIAILGSVNDDLADIRQGTDVEAHLTKPLRLRELRECLGALLCGTPVPHATRETGDEPLSGADLGLRVLLAEDNAVNQEVATRMLTMLGCEPTVVMDGEQAVDAFAGGTFEVVLMDCQMPRMDGFAATRRIRTLEGERGMQRTPIIALTANALSNVRQRCLDCGMDDYVSKPFSASELRAALTRVTHRTLAPPAPEADTPAAHDAHDAQGLPVEGGILDPKALERLRSLRRDDAEDVIGRFAGMYRSAADEILARLRAAVAQADATEICEAAHMLKSSSASVGASRLAQLCKTLETSVSQGVLDDVPAAVEQIHAEYEDVCEALARAGEAEQAA